MNSSFTEILKEQCALHPSFIPQDALKLCYQATFGAEHLLSDPIGARSYFEQEFATAGRQTTLAEPLVEVISTDFCRINLRVWKAKNLPAQWLFSLFLDSTQALPSTAAPVHTISDDTHQQIVPTVQTDAQEIPSHLAQRFEENVAEITALALANQLPFSHTTWITALTLYQTGGIRAVHHSEAYRVAEQPAYRLIRRRFLPLLPLLERLITLPTPLENKAVVLAIDGRCGAGKTTLATALANVLQTQAIQMDDFFLPPDKRTPIRLSTPGGNVDYERFGIEVLPFLRCSHGFSYQKFHCATMQLGEMRHIPTNRWRVVEGSYAHHPYFLQYANLRIFVTIDPKTQNKRILARNGAAWAKEFKQKWIPMEEKYFSTYHIPEKADLILTDTPV
ncbi:MAG: hypothetical protein R3Y06_03395 [Faecalibacterium sp.]